MVYESLQQNLRGVAFTTPTLFSEDGSEIEYDEMRSHVQWLEDAGADVFIPCGNTGEYYSLTDEERVRVVRETVDAVSDDSTVIAGAGGSLAHAISLADAYADAGVDGILVMSPPHTYIHVDGLVDYYRELAAATDLGVVIYQRNDDLTVEALSELTPIENVVALKYAVNDIDTFARVAAEFTHDVVITTGIAERFAPAFALEGAEGFTTGIGGFAPNASLALMDALRSEDWNRARHIRDEIRPYEELREEPGEGNLLSAANNVPAVKYGLELAGLYGGPVRPPITGLSAADKERAEEDYERLRSIDYES